MEERKVELVVPSSSKTPSERTKQPSQSDEVEMLVGCVDPRLRIQDSERTEYVAPVSMYATSPLLLLPLHVITTHGRLTKK